MYEFPNLIEILLIRFVNEECSRVMKGKGDHCFRDNLNGWGWLKLVTHQTLR